MKIYTEFFGLKISKEQKQTLEKLKEYHVNVAHFIRLAIKEKIQRDYSEIKINYSEITNECLF